MGFGDGTNQSLVVGFGDGTYRSLMVGFVRRSKFGDGFHSQIEEEWWLD